MAFGQEKIEELKNRADIVEVIGAHVRLRRAGNRFVGLCPFHNEKTPSFSVSPDRGFFYCFGCGAGGTVFNFVMRIEGLSFPEAVRSLARRYGVTIPERAEDGAKAGERDAMFRANEVASEFFVHVLWNTPDGAAGRDYLKSRGITPDTAKEFRLGFSPARSASLVKALEKRDLIDAAIKLGLIRKDQSGMFDMFHGRLMFPIRDVQGRVIGFGGRVLGDHLPKYINSPESPLYSKARNVYGIYEARQAIAKADRAIVVEGYIDAIAVSQAGFKEVVASLGTALTADQLRLLGRYTKNVFACFDGDAAGRKASLRALEVFLTAGLLGRGIFIPSGYDPDTLIRDKGAQAFGKLIESSELLIDYFIREQADAARESIAARARAAERVAEMLKMVANPFEFDLLARKAASSLGIGEEVLRDQAFRRRGRMGKAGEKVAGSPFIALGRAQHAWIGLIAAAEQIPKLRVTILQALESEHLVDTQLGATLVECCREEEGSWDGVLEDRLSENQMQRLNELRFFGKYDDQKIVEMQVLEYIAALRHDSLEREAEAQKNLSATAETEEAAIARAQKVITLRRAARGEQ